MDFYTISEYNISNANKFRETSLGMPKMLVEVQGAILFAGKYETEQVHADAFFAFLKYLSSLIAVMNNSRGIGRFSRCAITFSAFRDEEGRSSCRKRHS